MRSQLEIRDSQIYELKRLYKEARDAETRNAEIVQQLRVELARHDGRVQCTSAGRCTENSNVGMINVDTGSHQMQNKDLQDCIAQLQSQLRFGCLC